MNTKSDSVTKSAAKIKKAVAPKAEATVGQILTLNAKHGIKFDDATVSLKIVSLGDKVTVNCLDADGNDIGQKDLSSATFTKILNSSLLAQAGNDAATASETGSTAESDVDVKEVVTDTTPEVGPTESVVTKVEVADPAVTSTTLPVADAVVTDNLPTLGSKLPHLVENKDVYIAGQYVDLHVTKSVTKDQLPEAIQNEFRNVNEWHFLTNGRAIGLDQGPRAVNYKILSRKKVAGLSA